MTYYIYKSLNILINSTIFYLEQHFLFGTTDWLQIGKGVHQGCILSPCLFNFYADYIMRNAGLEEAQVGIKIARRNINNLRYTDDTTLMGESEEELKSLLIKVKEESEKVGLKLSIQKTNIMASGLITLWQIDGETVADFFGAPKSLQMGTTAMKLKDAYPLEGKLRPTSVRFSSVTQSCLTLCDTMNCSTPGLHHQLPEFTQTHVHQVRDAIQPSHPLSSSSPPAPNPSQNQSLFQCVNSSHEVLEFQPQH